VGAGACEGGQACKQDGSGFEPCDCGTHDPRNTSASSPSDAGTL
jgi:hypothetical protein